MLFNSIDFAVFLPIVFGIYWAIGNLRVQNFFLLLASFVFYGWWDIRFLSLLILSTCIDFFIGRFLHYSNDEYKRKILLFISIFSNLGILAFFKYFNFFIDNLTIAFSFFGMPFHFGSLEIILPVGISFYTFQTMSYTIDIYRRRMQPTSDLIAFSAYVSFFPQLVAGPIERAKNLLPQFFIKRHFDYSQAVNASKQILWGFLKKLVIADNCATLADTFFNHHSDYTGSALLLGAFFFTFQIYGDFSGYSDIAIGVARLFGFELMKNFSFPYFSRDLAEFWRRWHISLSTWFRDYVYIPLGGNQGSTWVKLRNIFIIFILSGCWHGANWTYVVWGLLHALFFVPLLIFGKNRQHLDVVSFEKKLPSFKEVVSMMSTFIIVMLLWIFFRSDSLSTAMAILDKIFSFTLFTIPVFEQDGLALSTLILILFFTLVEWSGRTHAFAIEYTFSTASRSIRWTFYGFLIALIGLFMQTNGSPFIYFQF